jgi:hypothetical protein
MGASSFLRRVLLADAVISGLSGILMVLDAGALESMLGVPATLLRYAGLSLFPFAALVVGLARREPLPRAGVWTVIALNAAWVVASLMLAFSGWISPNALGYAFILGQAFAVAVFAEMQYFGLRKAVAAVA